MLRSPGLGGTAPGRVAIDARATVRGQIGGVERFALQMAAWLPRLRPDRYHVMRPHPMLGHRVGHVWEQLLFPIEAARCALMYCPANLAPVVSGRSVAVIHDLAALRFPQAYSRSYVAYQRLMLPALARRARLLITVSAFSKSELVDLLGVAPERIEVVPGGVEEQFASVGATERAAVAARYGLKRPYVLALGTISARKNLRLLEPAARVLETRGIELVVAGGDRRYLRSPGSSLRRLGYVPDHELPGLYAGARALAMPSRYEGFGLPCLEAMACGAPVVASRSGALPETVGDAGLLVDADHGDAFADALLAVATDGSLRARLSEAGRRRASMFTWERSAELTDALLGRLLDNRAPIDSGWCSSSDEA